MAYTTAAYDKQVEVGFGPDPVAIVVAEGTHDVSRLVHLLHRGNVEQLGVATSLTRQLRRHSGGRSALNVLFSHGGPDLLIPPQPAEVLLEEYRKALEKAEQAAATIAEATIALYREYIDVHGWDDHEAAARQATLDVAEGQAALRELAEAEAELTIAQAAGRDDIVLPNTAIEPIPRGEHEPAYVESFYHPLGRVFVTNSDEPGQARRWRVIAYNRDAGTVRLRPTRLAGWERAAKIDLTGAHAPVLESTPS